MRVPPPELEALYQNALEAKSDVQLHLPTLRALAERSGSVVEFGVRSGISSIALLAGQPDSTLHVELEHRWTHLVSSTWWFQVGKNLRSDRPEGQPLTKCHMATFGRTSACLVMESTLELPPIGPTDLLFVDTLHTGRQLRDELERHGERAKVIALHDVSTFGEWGEDGRRPGLRRALAGWLHSRTGRGHRLVVSVDDCNGLAILARREHAQELEEWLAEATHDVVAEWLEAEGEEEAAARKPV